MGSILDFLMTKGVIGAIRKEQIVNELRNPTIDPNYMKKQIEEKSAQNENGIKEKG